MKEQESTTSYTLIWEVFSFTPVIEYSLLFREYMPNKDTMRYDWTKLTIPAEYSSNGVLHSMLYTIRGLKEKSRYEALLMSRNKYGWSKPSPILRFATKGAGKKDFWSVKTKFIFFCFRFKRWRDDDFGNCGTGSDQFYIARFQRSCKPRKPRTC